MKKKRCLIFGSNGFIAKNFSEKKNINNKFQIIRLPKKKINLLNEKSIFKLKKIIKDGDYIFFAAGEVPAKNHFELQNNVKIINNFLTSIQGKKLSYILYLSSDAVYKDTKKKITENSEAVPDSFHGTMHLIREELRKRSYFGKIGIFRPTLIFGSKDPHNGYGPNKFIRHFINNKKVELFGKGEELRDHIKVDSVTDILAEALIYKKVGTFNIATGKVFSFYNIAKKIQKKLTKKNLIIFKKRNGPLHHLGLRQFDINKIKRNFKECKFTNIMNYLDNEDLNEYKNKTKF